ncbi:Acetyl esterase [Neobacillus rhizosphaerae]|uniref:Acetyl esterase n=1 Tax=Neobacillus rhizosphaerae TaxID=2880965 RepID=A0ABM9EKJ4_9BACI|nr:alpha/beta hydrolase [Neobacillus rhizosphaerae]CAH2713088.1 Acetyl esterase [Neobacillus rhizosphaerae]
MKKTVIYKQDDRFTIKADFYETNHTHAPVVVYIHGGGLVWGTREDISDEMIKLYTDNGFALFSIDYRLAPETKLPDIIEDIQDALHWIESEGPKHFSFDPKRIAVVGSSAGGFLALSTGTFTHKPRAIVSFYGYGDIVGNWATSPSKFYCQKDLVPNELAKRLISDHILTEASIEQRFLLYVYARQHGEWIQEITGVNPTINKEVLQKFCPKQNITKDYPPTLLLHGTKDTDVPYEQSVFMRAALIKEQIETKLITIPNGEHVFDKDFHHPVVQDALNQMIEFLQIHLSE